MDKILGSSGEQLLQLGLPGIVIVFLALALWRVFRLYVAAVTKCNEVQEHRVKEVAEFATATVKAMEAQSDAVERLRELIRDRMEGRR